MAFSLAGDPSPTSVISLKIEIDFAADGNKIRISVTEVLLHTAAGDLAHSNKQRDWTPRNAFLLTPFLTEDMILHGESDAGELLKIFSRSITECAKEGENTSKVDDDNDKDSVITIKAEDEKTVTPGKAKQATAETFTTIADNCDNVLAFLQAVTVKSPQVIVSPLSLCADKRARF